MMLVRAYPRETQEMMFDAHERAFAFFRGACSRGIYHNMKTAVETIFISKHRQYYCRFLQICPQHLVEPVACTPALGWEKGRRGRAFGLYAAGNVRAELHGRASAGHGPGLFRKGRGRRRLSARRHPMANALPKVVSAWTWPCSP
jgi:transposase